MNWFRLSGERLGLWRCCWLQYSSGELVLRIARKGPFGLHRAFVMVSFATLYPNGKVGGPSYVHAWYWNSDSRKYERETEELERMAR